MLLQTGQKAIQSLSGAFHKDLKKGDPKAFHVVVYLGKGRTAEAGAATSPSLDLQASHASPMAFYAQLEVGKSHHTWTGQGAVVVKK